MTGAPYLCVDFNKYFRRLSEDGIPLANADNSKTFDLSFIPTENGKISRNKFEQYLAREKVIMGEWDKQFSKKNEVDGTNRDNFYKSLITEEFKNYRSNLHTCIDPFAKSFSQSFKTRTNCNGIDDDTFRSIKNTFIEYNKPADERDIQYLLVGIVTQSVYMNDKHNNLKYSIPELETKFSEIFNTDIFNKDKCLRSQRPTWLSRALDLDDDEL